MTVQKNQNYALHCNEENSIFVTPSHWPKDQTQTKDPCGTATLPHYLLLKNPPKTPNISSNFDLNGLGLLGFRRWQLLNGDGQHPILTYSRDFISIRILRQHELPHKLPHSPLHSYVLGTFLLLLPLPLSADHQHIAVLHLNLDVAGPQPRHVDDEGVGIRVLLDVSRRRRHGLGVPDVGAGGSVERLVGIVAGVEHVLEGWEEWRIKTHDPQIHFAFQRLVSEIC